MYPEAGTPRTPGTKSNAVRQRLHKPLREKSRRTTAGTALAPRPEREALEAEAGPAQVRRAQEPHRDRQRLGAGTASPAAAPGRPARQLPRGLRSREAHGSALAADAAVVAEAEEDPALPEGHPWLRAPSHRGTTTASAGRAGSAPASPEAPARSPPAPGSGRAPGADGGHRLLTAAQAGSFLPLPPPRRTPNMASPRRNALPLLGQEGRDKDSVLPRHWPRGGSGRCRCSKR